MDQRGGRVCQFLLGLVQKTQTNEEDTGIQLAPTPQVSEDPKIILPHPIFHPTLFVVQWREVVSEVVRMRAKQGAGPGAGSERNVGLGGNCCCQGGTAAALGKQGREGGKGVPRGLPRARATDWGVAWGGELGARLPELGPPGK